MGCVAGKHGQVTWLLTVAPSQLKTENVLLGWKEYSFPSTSSAPKISAVPCVSCVAKGARA